ncbi:hypothetical protein OH733_05205 [Streptomyces griseus]|uniref:hypothetical protein n=1 Tax=Streptomyces griseus TaxID=1911 RepID=UPI00386B2C01|nr:hypothetical protein OH733_05205 [Streptomyces griseus]WTD71202.1 hypothetical protein OH763_31780 [Streptomyces griseus]
MSIVAEVRKLVTEYGGIRERQEKELDEFRDGPGGEVVDWVRYDAARARHSEDDSERYAALVGELAKLAGPLLAVGDVVIVPDNSTTVEGGFVGFSGEVTAEVEALEDGDGDILVCAEGVSQYVDPRQVQLVEQDVQV